MEERLGEGAVGVVYRAVHIDLEKSFAIKLLKTSGPPSSTALERFRREAVALGRLRHPNIIEVTDFGIDESEGDRPYIVTELLEGRLLSEACRDQGPLPLAQALPFLEQIAAAVDAAHEAGILHRDLKPGNVFVCSESPDSPNVKVLDFGLAKLLTEPDKPSDGTFPVGGESPPALTTTGLLLGTPLYMAPELIRHGKASRSSDIYSFGALAYEILGGKPPFQGTLEEVLAGHLNAEPPPLPLSPEVWHPLRATLQKDPAHRPDTAGEVVHRLTEASTALAERQGVGWAKGQIKKKTRAFYTVLFIAFCGLVLATIVLAYWVSPEGQVSPLGEWLLPLWPDAKAQTQTVEDIRSLGTAMMKWNTDQLGAAAAGQSQVSPPATVDLADYQEISQADLEKILVPRYAQRIPKQDGWGHSYKFYLNADKSRTHKIMAILSPGRDGVFEGSSYVAGWLGSENFDEDIVWSDGSFVRWP